MSTEITKDEAAIYDRQIRLWGPEAQKRIGQASILIAGMRALSDEVCKNLALAGVASITLLDHELVTEFDLGAQFFLTEENVGQNKAKASAPFIENLNPRVKVFVDQENINEKTDDYFESFTVVCLVHSNYNIMSRVDKVRRNVNKPFYAGDVFGWYGYIFCDLAEHTYVQVKKSGPSENPKVEHTPVTVNYPSLEDSLRKSWAGARPKELKKLSPLVLLVHVLLNFQKEHNRSPTESDAAALISSKKNYLESIGITDFNRLSDDLLEELASSYHAEIISVASIVGGILSQDIIRALARNELTIDNYYHFNAKDCTGTIIKL
ncbi:hypothetical protein INT47_010674 [Mucor saturninus]|uniref:Ubiquitin-like 1-activating enzyme E1A n=1 Tax=Mucor saturninus TaxID=64648 RepID=A0A8H7UZF6_9FUNG|nr:hypothetical protein INT47_010674 [Mucor saturninus]